MLKKAALAAALGASLAAAAPAVAAPTLAPRPCGQDAPKGARCSTLTVPLDRSGATPGTLDLPVQVLAARGPAPRRGPLLMLAGGPGQEGIDSSSPEVFAQLAPGYDVVAFDQRGTGGTALRCGALAGEDLDDPEADLPAAQSTRLFARCADQLGAARRFYTSADSAADIDDLRAALGAEQITLGGTSYGTWVTQVYARMFPQRVKRIVLDSVVGPDGVHGIARSEYAGARRVVRAQCARGACRGITRRPLADVERLVARMDARPLRGRVVTPAGRRRRASVGGPEEPGVLNALFYAGDLDPHVRAAFPAAVAAALDGDPALLLRLAAGADDDEPEDPAEISGALYAATTCAETALPWAGADPFDQRRAKLDAAVAALPAGELAPWGRAAALASPAVAGCLEWPESPFAGPPAGALPDVPALVLNGLADVRTPVEDARAVAARLPRSTLVEIPHQGHSVFVQACAQRAVSRFLAGRRVAAGVCARTPGQRLLPVPPRALADVGPRGRSMRDLARRSLRATRLAVSDAAAFMQLYDGAPRFPGLRGGIAGLRGSDEQPTLVLRDYVYAPGLRVSGRLRLAGPVRGRLRVGGPRTMRGRLVVRRGVARGRLGGFRVALRFQARGA